MATASSEESFFQKCPASSCSEGGPEIRFPFRLATSPLSCGAPGMELVCSKADTVLVHPNLGLCKVTAIWYGGSTITIVPLAAEPEPKCPFQKIISTNLSTDVYRPYGDRATLVSCSAEFIVPSHPASLAGPISCLTNASRRFTYLVPSFRPMDFLPLDCTVLSNSISVPYPASDNAGFNETARGAVAFGETMLEWRVPNITDVCRDCEAEGRLCGFSSESRQAFCKSKNHSSRLKVIAVTTPVAAVLVLSAMAGAALLHLALKSKYDDEIHRKVEMFLETYRTLKPRRYTFSEVRKMTRRFSSRLGQGGFGSVYKGELPNGGVPVPVAVKMLEDSTGEEEFISEVATIGTIHHANVVRLLGFCSERSRRALVYEFMPNASLEKYIRCSSQEQSLITTASKMLEIATGIARGIEYLHQGCDQRILHFDIKPSNILLDYNLNPKISDFGLAKLCARDQSVVALTAARGTMGYIAPELYSRNFGTVSCKSDVYSFGMVVMEMVVVVSAKRRSMGKCSPAETEDQNDDVCVPEWIYEEIVTGQEPREMARGERDMVRKLAIVALWCIQWNPPNRPSMTTVVNMLTDSLQSLKIPPKPFVSSFVGQ